MISEKKIKKIMVGLRAKGCLASILIAVCILIILFILSGCAQLSSKAASAPGLTPVKVQLKWLHLAQFAGNYVANEKGFYKANGLDVALLPFDYVHFPIEEVEKGSADFGIAGADELLVAKDLGKADHVKAIAVIFKINPVCLYSLKESGIKKPQDFIGKTVNIRGGKNLNVNILYNAMMTRLGIDRSRIKEVTIEDDSSELLSGKIDVSSGYIINEPDWIIAAGRAVNIILVSDYGVNMYADVIIANENTIENNPELVMKFISATLKGWQYAIENEDEAVNITMKYDNISSISHEKYMLAKAIPLVHTGESYLGLMEQAKWESAQQILLDQNIISRSVNLSDVFTNDFVNKIYSGNPDR